VGEQAKGLVVTQVVPNPESMTLGVTKEYQAALKKSSAGGEPNYSSLEGYIAARVLIEGVKRGADRERFVRGFAAARTIDLGGFDLNYGPTDNTGSQFVELTHFNGEKFRR
jgi:branched-chain amino acid transport system substrate-binding protein